MPMKGGNAMLLKEAISCRLHDLMTDNRITGYGLYLRSGVPKATISNVLHGRYDSVKIRILYEICQGLNIGLSDFFKSDYFDEERLEP